LLAGTLVVEAQGKGAGESALAFVLALLSVSAMFGGTLYLTFTKPLPSDLRAVDRARNGLEIMAQIEESVKAARGTYTASLPELAAASGDAAQFKSALQ